MTLEPGLYVVATPIGNLADFSERGQQVLRAVDLIAAEDTRHSRRLLTAFAIGTRLTALHDHNERTRSPQLLDDLQRGGRLALISDAGTPLVSDPGYRLVSGARDRGVAVYPIPGPCSAVAALSVAGLASDRFAFEGFLPAKPTQRRARLAQLAASEYTLIFFVAARAVTVTVADMAELFGAGRRALIAREISKLYEQSRRDSLAGLADWLRHNEPRGEFVIVVEAAAPAASADDDDDGLSDDAERLLKRLLAAAALPLKEAVAIAAELSGEQKNRLYRRALAIRATPDPGE